MSRIICDMSSVYTVLASALSAGMLRPAESGASRATGRAIREKHLLPVSLCDSTPSELRETRRWVPCVCGAKKLRCLSTFRGFTVS